MPGLAPSVIVRVCSLYLNHPTLAVRAAASRCTRTGREQMQQATSLLDHLVGAQQKRLRERQAKRLGGFEIDDQFVFDGILHW